MSLDLTVGPSNPNPQIEDEASILARQKTRTAARRRNIWLLRLAIVVVWLGSWELAGRFWIDPFFYSMPSKIWERLTEWFITGTDFGSIWYQILVTVEEAVLGFVIGAALGVLLGVVLGRSQYLSDVLAPFIKAANALPRIVLAALFVIWFGLGMSSKVATVVVLVFFAVFFNAFTGAREVDRNLIDNARILGATRWQVLKSIVLPSATSWILSSLHVAFGFALIGAVVGEYTGAKAGMGFLIANAQGTFDTAGVYAGMLIITVVALLAEWGISTLESRLLRWRPQVSAQASQGI
ncbi:ABC transporter permease [Amycolatopsis echigonensis]|uniref:ABC transporter permease n=1 Tax=Amycolatopsis echigonensis TaxID=2576905 RepID=A0A8E1VWI2_9PSEU|nr:ABC transporter permease [Amycolatopsis echigonensis]MBB2499597.1 ABC transporter permease [Amycolatopsis echigonensis]